MAWDGPGWDEGRVEDRYARDVATLHSESMLSLMFPDGSAGGGAEVVSRGAFYEDWGDAVAALDPAAARTAYAQAEELFATFASWAPAGDDGTARMVDVDRVRLKQLTLS